MIPSGLVAFLFTDVEGSTRLWAADGAAMSASLRTHDAIMRSSIESHNGYVFTTAGDAFCVAFQRATDAVAAASDAQQRLADADWPGPALRVRMGLHLGEAEERGGDFFGPVLNLAARVEAAGHGGQVLLTEAVRGAANAIGSDLGEHRLKDVPEPVHLWQLGDGKYPALRTTQRTNLPNPATRLLGRSNDARSVRSLLTEHRLVTLLAGGGTGKTRLAIEVGDQELPTWRDGVWFCDLTEVSRDGEVSPVVAGALGLEQGGGNPVAEITGYLAGRELLLILDNCEHVVESAADLASAVLAAGGRSKMLATSRELLDVYGERGFQVTALSADSPESPAVQLFTERAVAVSSGFSLNERNAAAVGDLCRRLDGTPLAIELAASRVGIMTPAMLVEGLTDRFQLLSGGRRRQRRRTLEATIDWSYELLDEDERQVFRAMGVFVGTFDVDALAAIAGRSRNETIEIAESLAAKSMTSAAGPGRLRLLETLKAYAEERLAEHGETARRTNEHADYFLDQVSIDSWYEGSNMLRNLRLSQDYANLLSAANWLANQGRWADLSSLLMGLNVLTARSPQAVRNLVQRCAAQSLSNHDLERLWIGDFWLSQMSGDFETVHRRATALKASDIRSHRGFVYFRRGINFAPVNPEYSRRCLDTFLELEGGRYGGRPEAFANTGYAFAAASAGNYAVAIDHARSALAGFSQHVERSHYWADAQLIIDVARWAQGEPSDFIETVATIRKQLHSVTAFEPYIDRYLEMYTAFGCAAESRANHPQFRSYLVTAASGQIASHQSDALVLLAEVERVAENHELARELILSTGNCSTSGSMIAAGVVARRLGVHDDYSAQLRTNALDPAWAQTRPMTALRSELKRRGWSET